MKTTETIKIQGMSCGHCVKSVREALEETEGVEVEDVEIGTARISYDTEKTSREQIEETIEDAGYKVA
jgi:copper ion binding protein